MILCSHLKSELYQKFNLELLDMIQLTMNKLHLKGLKDQCVGFSGI